MTEGGLSGGRTLPKSGGGGSGHLVIGGQAGNRRKRACAVPAGGLGMNRLAALDGNGERVCSCLPVELRSSGPGPIARSAEGAMLALCVPILVLWVRPQARFDPSLPVRRPGCLLAAELFDETEGSSQAAQSSRSSSNLRKALLPSFTIYDNILYHIFNVPCRHRSRPSPTPNCSRPCRL